jgi:phosphoribosylamine--glycine ligase
MKEGHLVGCYVHNRMYSKNYDNMIPKVTLRGVRAAAEKADIVIFDMNRPVEDKFDKAFHKLFGVTGKTVYGPAADALRKRGKLVIGSSEWTERLELDRGMGDKVAQEIGLKSPSTQKFPSLSAGLSFLKKNEDKLWVFKPSDNQDLDLTYIEKTPGELAGKFEGEFSHRLPDGTAHILQEKIDGAEISTEAWWTGSKWVAPNHTIEDKCLMNHDLGPRVGSANNTVWLKTDGTGLLMDSFKKLTPYVKRCGYVGPVDINAIVTKQGAYFLEFTTRCGFDALYCLLSLLNGKIGDFFTYVAGEGEVPSFKRGFASSVRVSVPPYPYEVPELLKRAEGIVVDADTECFWLEDVHQDGDRVICSGADGILGVVACHGNSLGGSVGNVYRELDKVTIGGYAQYRTDAGNRAKTARRKLKDWGYSID